MPSFRSSRVFTPEGARPASVRVEDSVVVAIDESMIADRDYGDLAVLPGLVDSHVHVNEPGRTDWEGFASATRAAAAGGATTIVDMPLNSIPPTTTVAALEEKRSSAEGQLSVDVAFWGGIIPGSQPEIPDLVSAGVCGFKVFLTDSGVPEFPPLRGEDLESLGLPVPLLVHAEDDDHLGEPGPTYEAYLASRPATAEAAAIDAVSGLGFPVHILHVSSAEGVDAISEGPDSMTGETCPHYLTFSAGDVTGAEFKCAPPIREPEHQEALWEGLVTGALSMVVSDHSPSPPTLKRGDFATAWGGIASLQLRLQVVWTEASRRGVSLEVLPVWMAAQPARLAGLDDRKGSIEVGKAGDLVVFDPEGRTVVHGSDLYHRHPLTPYEGMALRGVVVETVLAGEVVYDGDNVRVGRGKMLVRK